MKYVPYAYTVLVNVTSKLNSCTYIIRTAYHQPSRATEIKEWIEVNKYKLIFSHTDVARLAIKAAENLRIEYCFRRVLYCRRTYTL